MKKQFIKIGDLRIKRNSIKKYLNFSKDQIVIYFTSVANAYETETITFKNEKLKKECLKNLDLMFDGELFIVGDLRIKLNTIKKYKPLNGVKLSVYYGTSRSKVKVDVFEYANHMKRSEAITELDIIMGVI